MRKLASIQYVHDITPIDGADRIELAHVLGWQVVVNKGQFKVGDHAVYFEVDSFLPIEPRFEFLRKSSYKKSDLLGDGFRLKTAKLRGEISQGLLMPLSDFPEITTDEIGRDVTETLKVRKYEIEERATAQGTIIGELPSDIPFTDEQRVQASPELIKELDGQPYYITTKMDGSSHSIELNADNEFIVTGHRYQYLDDGKSSFYGFVKKMGFEQKLRALKAELGAKSIVVQGEFCAPGIQSNPIKLDAPHWYVFTVASNGRRQGLAEFETVADRIGAEKVPVEEVGEHFAEKYPTVDAVLARADESMYTVGRQKCKAEGIVVRPTEPVLSETIGTWLSMKAVSNKYLLKRGQ